jgi:hypothetical protein
LKHAGHRFRVSLPLGELAAQLRTARGRERIHLFSDSPHSLDEPALEAVEGRVAAFFDKKSSCCAL